MYLEPHLNEKSAECSKLWYNWYEQFIDLETRYGSKCKKLRAKWCKCADELGELVSIEAKTNPRYTNSTLDNRKFLD